MDIRKRIGAMPKLRVEVPLWECHVNVCGLTAAGRTRVRELHSGMKDGESDASPETSYAQLLVYSLRDDDGQLLFTEDDVPYMVEHANAQVLKELFDIAMPLCGFSPGPSGKIEALVKNCNGAPSCGLPSA